MSEAQSSVKLQTLVCEMKGYYNSNFSSPSPKEAFKLETEVESYRTIVMSFMTIGINNWMLCYKSSLSREKKRKHGSSFKKKRSPN